MKGVIGITKKSNSELFSSLLYIIGVLLVIFRSETLGWAITIAGIIFLISGILDLVKKNWAGGTVSLIIGLVILILGWAVAQIVLLVLGILFPILSVVVGLMLAFCNALDIMSIITGVFLIVDGIIGLFDSLKK